MQQIHSWIMCVKLPKICQNIGFLWLLFPILEKINILAYFTQCNLALGLFYIIKMFRWNKSTEIECDACYVSSCSKIIISCELLILWRQVCCCCCCWFFRCFLLRILILTSLLYRDFFLCCDTSKKNCQCHSFQKRWSHIMESFCIMRTNLKERLFFIEIRVFNVSNIRQSYQLAVVRFCTCPVGMVSIF